MSTCAHSVSYKVGISNVLSAFFTSPSKFGRQGLGGGVIALKSDMSKVYDQVEWSYLRQLLHVSSKFGRQGLGGGVIALKSDMSKVYDQVEWSYLRQADEKNAVFATMDSVDYDCNTSHDAIQSIEDGLGIQFTTSLGLYLGLPSQISNNKNEVFLNIKNRVWKVLQGWKEKFFSIGGKEVLIKDVA
ncbi:uncharacterized protein LOC120077441 [Benincasa hispida]|uniref:uncharacterized protein LOC120077441 n=1 Tax=Benincasa hispida TaxID=102211 RepID=UPI0019017CDF|nr:uncharacterized protein LOC120077441 [Benincasa hispida]